MKRETYVRLKMNPFISKKALMFIICESEFEYVDRYNQDYHERKLLKVTELAAFCGLGRTHIYRALEDSGTFKNINGWAVKCEPNLGPT